MSNPDKRRVHVAEIKKTHKGKVHVSTYLRRTFRQDGKVKHETVANISDLPNDLLAVIKHGYSRDHRSDRPQIVYGLLCDPEGRPIAVEVFPGNTADPKAFTSIVAEVRQRFGITNVVFVGDRGMITTKRINEDLRDVDGLEWISALRTEGIRSLMDAGKISRSLFDEKD